MINLYFRNAIQKYSKTNNGEIFEDCLKDLKQRFENKKGTNWSSDDQKYFDLLFQINVRGKSYNELMQKAEKHDPEFEMWLKNKIEGNGLKPKLFIYSKEK